MGVELSCAALQPFHQEVVMETDAPVWLTAEEIPYMHVTGTEMGRKLDIHELRMFNAPIHNPAVSSRYLGGFSLNSAACGSAAHPGSRHCAAR